jgi:hypothetical protein
MNEYTFTKRDNPAVFKKWIDDSEPRIHPEWGVGFDPIVTVRNVDAELAQQEEERVAQRSIIRAIRAASTIADIKQILIALAKLSNHAVD